MQTWVQSLLKKYPDYVIFFSLLLFSWIGFSNHNNLLEIKHPPKEGFPWLYFVNKVYENSILTSGILKIAYENSSWIFISGILGFYFFHWYKNKKFFLLDIIYFCFLLILKLISNFYLFEWKNALEIFELPFILILYAYFFHYLFCFYIQQDFKLEFAREFFLASYGKIFFFLYVLNLGIESLPFDELSIYSQKYGIDNAWKIIVYRNLVFDILFFALIWSYLVYISFFKQIHFITSFLSLKKILQSIKWKIFYYGFIYYFFISLVTFLDFYLNLKNWKLIFFTLIHLILLERMYSFFKEYFQSLGKTNAERTKTQRTRR